MTAPDAESGEAARPRPAPPPLLRGQAPFVAVVAAGGALGATARYAAGLWWPARPGGFPWTTFWVNVTGCALMGVLMVVVTEVRRPHRLVRPFLGTGVLGGYTTFSTYGVDTRWLVDSGRAATGLLYLAATPLAALTAVWLATLAARAASAGRESGRTGREG
ncbi:fluoride efflux transporter CrcB [Streptomyces sp. NPDC090306]|uniref:fluoride efflux transporter CrcB n=1 Tax=unclassified Streptomyces TaxID=2593676 RepID=UPI0036E24917